MLYIRKKAAILITTAVVSAASVFLCGIINLSAMCRNQDESIVLSDTIRNLYLDEAQRAAIFISANSGCGGMAMGVSRNVLENKVLLDIYAEMKNKQGCDRYPLMLKKYVNKAIYGEVYSVLYSILADIRVFPVALDAAGGVEAPYENSWGAARTYGGTRTHEGTDIMAGNNLRGFFPVVSMTDGVVENMGWLELGGFRIGIRSPSGAYFYYAHLCEYAEEIEEGKFIKAGTVLGTMGDTGYGKEEGTKGLFDVHLHLGIYCDVRGKEVSFNPFYILKSLEKYRLEFMTSN